MTHTLPNGCPSFSAVKGSLPELEHTEVTTGVELETLFLPGPDPTIVFIHGGLGSLWNPYLQLDAFRGEQGLLTYSLAGNGNSSTRSKQTVTGHVADLAGLIDELGVENPILHGWSYGTAIALEYAKRHTTAGLVLHAGGSHGLTPEWEKPFLETMIALRLYKLPTNRRLMRRFAYAVAIHGSTPTSRVDDFLETNPIPRRRSAWKTVTEAFWGYDGRSDLDCVTVPTLVIHGPADRIVPLSVARETATRLPNAVFCRLERTGHVAPVERPSTYNRFLTALIRAVSSDRELLRCVRRTFEKHR